MSRYLKTAGEANELIQKIVEEHVKQVYCGDVPDRTEFAIQLGKLYNLGIRTAPRACQATVRLRAVERALQGFNVTATMVKVQGENDYSFNALMLVNNLKGE